MSEEEKKAIEHTERFCYGKQLWEEDLECIKALLNLIEKQNNRLEQLEKENKDLLKTCKEQSELIEDTYINYNDLEFTRLKRINKELEKENKELKYWKREKGCSIQEVYELFIPKSVIRDKIEELEKLEKGFNFTGLITECETKIEVLKEILEE